MTWNELTENVKIKFNDGKEKVIDIWNDHRDEVVGIGVLAGALIGGAILGSKSGKKSMRKEVDKANKARLLAESQRDTMSSQLEAELLANEASDRLHSIVLLPDGRRMTGAHFVDVVLENTETNELIDIMSR